MEARLSVLAACFCALLPVAGCSFLNGDPAARPAESDNPPAREHTEVVEADPPSALQPAASVEPDIAEVQRWIEQIERVDDVRSRVSPEPPGGTLSSGITGSYEAPDRDLRFAQGDDPTPLPGDPSRSAAGPASDPAPTHEAAEAAGQDPVAPSVPILESVSVRAAASENASALPPTTSAPAVNAPAQAAHQPITLKEFATQWLARATDVSLRDQLDRRLLLVLAGEYEQARQPLELVSPEQQQMATRFVEALIAIRDAHGGEPGEEANRVLAQLRQLEESLVPLSALRIPKLALTRAIRGFGRYDAFDPPCFPAGTECELVVYCELANFVSRETDSGTYESHFSMRTAVLNRAGELVLEINDDQIIDECRTRRHDCFIPRLIRLPATLSPGEYVVKVTVTDRIGEKVAEKRTAFRIVARS
jgi:hypothetical protein